MTGSKGDPGPREQDSSQTLSPAFLGPEVVGREGSQGPLWAASSPLHFLRSLSGRILFFAYTGQLAWTLLV